MTFHAPGPYGTIDIPKELQWFAVLLVVVLTILTLMGTNDDSMDLSSTTYTFVVFGFTLVWIIRSAAIKYFSK